MAMAMARSTSEDRLVFSSLMPHLFHRLPPPPPDDTTLTEQELQEINRLLTLEKARETEASADRRKRSKHDDSGLRKTSKLPLTLSDKHNGNVEAAFSTKQSLAPAVYCDGKENVLSCGALRRNRFSRRERSSRITSRRKPFVVDLGKFNIQTLEECRKGQDVHEFWEAAEERDASEAIINKLKGESEPFNEKLRTRAVRRGNSQRTTSRSRRFSVELPSFVEQVILDERPEHEPDLTEDSCFTLLSDPHISAEQSNMPQAEHCMQSDSAVEKPCTHGEANPDSDVFDGDMSPLVKSKEFTQNDIEHDDSGNEIPDFLNRSPGSPDKQGNQEMFDEDNMAITPFMRKRTTKTTPFTSPTPPPNPLAGIHIRDNDNVFAEDSGKRRLDFMETTDAPDLEPELDVHATNIDLEPELDVHATNIDLEPEDTTNIHLEPEDKTNNLPQKQNPDDSIAVVEETLSKQSLETPVAKQKPPQTTRRSRKRPLDNRRSSLAAAGTKWDVGVRRSTRIRSRPLEWWKGERFLLGRVHKSLVTVIGIKYTSASPCDSKKGAKFKVESYVPEEYAKYVQFAAL